MNKRGVGKDKEEEAVYFLKEKGLRILDTNYNTRHGEIDIVALDDKYLVFAEVKFRSKNIYGSPLEAVTLRKQRSIKNAARVYLYLKDYPEDTYIRFDCIGISEDGIQWIRNAF